MTNQKYHCNACGRPDGVKGYRITLKDGEMFTDLQGNITFDGTRGMRFPPSEDWRILGFSTRHNARSIITLDQAANGTPIGHGWVHDLDHGSHRLWSMPTTRRAVSVERL